jgi:hypothetical protein
MQSERKAVVGFEQKCGERKQNVEECQKKTLKKNEGI